MYDTVRLFVPDVPHTTMYVTRLKQQLKKYNESRDQDGNYSLFSKLDNLIVSYTPSGLAVEGSMAKYYQGCNYSGLDAVGMNEVLEKLSNVFSVDMYKASVTRLDVAATVVLDDVPSSYFQYLGHSKYLNRGMRKNTLYYENTRRVICFYDKNKETLEKGGVVPAEYVGRNALRIELRYLQSVKAQLKKCVTGKDLIDEGFCNEMILKWGVAYEAIEKVMKPFDLSSIKKPKDFTNMLLRYALDKLGDRVWGMLNEVKFPHAKYKDRVIATLKLAMRGSGKNYDGVIELNSKVQEYAWATSFSAVA